MSKSIIYRISDDDIIDLMKEKGMEISESSLGNALEQAMFWLDHTLKIELGNYLDYQRN